MADFQDYAPRTIGSKTLSISASNKQAKAGQKKTPGSTGLSGKLDNQTAAQLDSADPKAPEPIGLDVGKAIAAARNAKGWKAPELANALNVHKSVVVDLESGKHVKDNQMMQKLERKLGVWLTGDPERLGLPKTRGKESKEKDAKDGEKKPAGKGAKTEKAGKEKEDNEVPAVESAVETEQTKDEEGKEGGETAQHMPE